MEKDSRAFKVVFSCLIGSALGTLISCSVNLKYFWLGILAGGLIGYLTYDFRQVYYACRDAFKKVFGWRPKPDWKKWKLAVRASWWLNFYLSSWMLPFIIIMAIFANGGERLILSIVLTSILCISISIALGIPITDDISETSYSGLRKTLIIGNPIYLIPAFTFYLLPLGIWWCIRRIPRAIVSVGHFFVLLGRFVKTVFILIHSEMRLLCGVDALIGGLIGFLIKQFYGGTLSTSVIIGACAGAFIGYLNYEIVSKRILRVAPVRNK